MLEDFIEKHLLVRAAELGVDVTLPENFEAFELQKEKIVMKTKHFIQNMILKECNCKKQLNSKPLETL